MLRAYRFAFFLALLSLLLLAFPVLHAFGATPSETRTSAKAINLGSGTVVGAATEVAKGCHLMSEAEAKKEQEAGNTSAKAGTKVCGSDSAIFSNDAAAAKAYLLSIARNLRNSQAPPDKAHIDPLNNSFAICAARFLKAYSDAKGPVYVVSAFRCGPNSPMSCDRTENGRAGGAGASNHQIGLALDVNPANGDYGGMHAFAGANKQYGVHFRLGMRDRPHLEPIDKSSPSCDGVAGTPVGSGGFRDPAPSGGLSDQIRQALGMQQQPPPPPPPPPPPQMQPAQQSQPLSTQPQLTAQSQTQQIPPPEDTINKTPYLAGTCNPQTRCVGNDVYYRATTCVDQLYKACTKGCEDAACNVTASADLLTDIQKSGTLADITIEEKPIGSVYDLIGNYADPISTSIEPVGTVSEIALNSDTSNDLVSETADTGPRILYPKNTANLPLSPSQQTFTSADLANSPSGYIKPQNTYALSVLESMKGALQYALTLLKPFGGRIPGQVEPGVHGD